MFYKRKKTQEEIIAEVEKFYQKKEITFGTLCEDLYKTGKSGVLTLAAGGMCTMTSIAFATGLYIINDRIFGEDHARLADNVGLLMFVLGGGAVASGFGIKFFSKFTIENYKQFKEHREEYRTKNLESKT